MAPRLPPRVQHLGRFLVLAGVSLLSAYFMALAYRRATSDAVEQLRTQERILAGQAVKGISEYFTYYRQTLEFLARSPEVVQNDARGQRLLKDLYLSQADNLLSVTRVGPDGRILYTYPDEQAAGRSIVDQPHVRLAFETRRPVVSQVFMSVQGFECVALHVPVFDGGRFAGTLAALIPFEAISRKHLEGVRIGRSGYAILLSAEGVELYCPVPGHVRRSIFETSRGFPALTAMAGRMLRGETGTSTYDYDRVGHSAPGQVRKHAYYAAIPLENTFWSISVTAPEEEALVFIRGFRDRWILGMTILMLAFGVWGVFLARAILRLRREEARQAAQERIQQAERERERALRESEEQFRTYFEDSLLGMAIASPDRTWLVVNERLTELLGYSADELRALTWTQLTHPDDLAADQHDFSRVLAGETEGYSRETRFVRKDGGVVHTIFSVRLIRRADGSRDHCLAQLQDITDRKALDEEKSRLGEQLRQAQKLEAIGQLAGGIAHDYNNLLTVQIGHLSLLKERPDVPADVAESLGEIEKSATMAAQLTRQLLAFSRRQVLRTRRLNLNDILDNLLKMLRRVLPEDITLELRTSAAPLWLDADVGMMEQVIVNLVVNARDAMPDGGRLTLVADAVTVSSGEPGGDSDARPGEYVRLTVQDSGTGMDPETSRRVFEPFFTTKEIGKGTGLGLATVYGIVKQHQGWIEVDSARGRGTVFRVYYPAAAAAAGEAPEGPADARSLLGRGGETILVAEDNPAVRTTLTATLRRMNYTVLEAENSVEAVRLWREHQPTVDLLLTDMVMVEGSSGVELARQLRNERPDLGVIVMSGYSEDLVRGGLGKDMAFLAKPWTAEILARTVRECLDSRRTDAAC